VTLGEIHKKFRIWKFLRERRWFAQNLRLAAGKGRYGAAPKKAPHILLLVDIVQKLEYKVDII